ncbi:MAG: TonB-dependent receptor [Deltaproteobacteria bacterium]|nr:TonB-dependent receptor [Deltaproteobacteria bacterium]
MIAATVRTGAQLLATTDEAGRFALTNLCKRPLSIVVERDDYKPVERTISISGHVSIEIELTTAGEVIELRDKAPPPPDMRSTATIDGAALEKSRGKAFTAALADVPGVSELRSATGVAKPIIRGQFGRRLLILVDGVRHRSQDWGLDHAPEIDPFIADRIRVVRGPGGVRYGSDAIGGVVLVDPPDLRHEPGTNGEVHAIGAANGRGGTLAARVAHAIDKQLGVQLEGSLQRLSAASTPDYALDNAGVFEWTAGATIGWRRKKAEYTASYRHFDAELGVCACLRVHNVEDFLAQAEAKEPVGVEQFSSDFEIDRPKQAVRHDLALARARFELAGGTLTSTASFQQDFRREFDVVRDAETAGAQYNFRLLTGELDTVFEHGPVHLSEHWHLRGSAGVLATAQVHDYAGLQLIPTYRGIGAGAYVTERLTGHDTDLELGVRYDALARSAALTQIDFDRLVRSGQLEASACTEAGDTVDCDSRYHTFATSFGVAQRFGAALSLKGDASIASRAPNPDEQYINGTSPTFPVLGLGKPDVRPETSYASSLTLTYNAAKVKGEASVFASYIDDYIYFAPALDADGAPVFDVTIRGAFPRFVTRGVDAVFYGADGGISVAPSPYLELAAQASLVRAKNRDDDSFLVFVPPDRYRGSITVRPPDRWRSPRKGFATLSGTYVTRQKRFDLAADFVEPPPAYFLLGGELGFETCFGHQTARFALQGSNLSNARYRDYTSLMRYFADEPGWQAWLRMTVVFDSKGTNK